MTRLLWITSIVAVGSFWLQCQGGNGSVLGTGPYSAPSLSRMTANLPGTAFRPAAQLACLARIEIDVTSRAVCYVIALPLPRWHRLLRTWCRTTSPSLAPSIRGPVSGTRRSWLAHSTSAFLP